MIEYKLIKIYPGHDTLGEIAFFDDGITSEGWLGTVIYNAHPEFWKKVVEFSRYVKWVDIIGSGGWGRMCDESDFKKGKIFDIEKDKFPFNITTWQKALTLERYQSNFIPATKEEYDAQFIEPKTYEILSFKGTLSSNDGLFYLKHDLYYWHTWGEEVTGLSLFSMLEGSCTPYSIKRLSDGEVFTIGDKIGADVFKSNKIERFDIHKDIMYVITSSGTTPLHLIYHAKKSLFTTEDGVDIFKGDKFYILLPNNKLDTTYDFFTANETIPFPPNNREKYFSTIESAEDYIAKQKVLFITEDEVEVKLGGTFWVVEGLYNTPWATTAKLKQGNYWNIIKDGRETNKYFSTKAKAQEYIDMNKPMYSKQDVLNMFSAIGNSRDVADVHLKYLIHK